MTIFTETAIQTKQEVQLTQGGMLLMALLGGGDYDTVGLSGCGATIAFKLSHTGLGDSLLCAAQQLLAPELAGFLTSWRNELRDELMSSPPTSLVSLAGVFLVWPTLSTATSLLFMSSTSM